MGLYIEPNGVDKDIWCQQNGRQVSLNEIKEFTEFHGDSFPVVVVDNGSFKAGGVAFFENELKIFTNIGDRRPKNFYIVPKYKLKEICPAWEHYVGDRS